MKKPVNSLSYEELLEHLIYDPETGIFVRRRTQGKAVAGTPCASIHCKGYIQISIKRRTYLAHRLAWLYMTGKWPDDLIDHRNGQRTDNRWTNLRQSTNAQNMQNKITCRSKAGLMGVIKRASGFDASMTVNRRTMYIGRFRTAEEAHEAYLKAKRIHHPHAHIAQ